MRITWLGHSCFKITSQNSSILIDPFEPGSVPGYSDISQTVDGVLCTHQHFDHNYTAGAIIRENPDLSAFHITEISAWHDDQNGALRGSNTIFLIEAEGLVWIFLCGSTAVPEERIPPIQRQETAVPEQRYRT